MRRWKREKATPPGFVVRTYDAYTRRFGTLIKARVSGTLPGWVWSHFCRTNRGRQYYNAVLIAAHNSDAAMTEFECSLEYRLALANLQLDDILRVALRRINDA